MTAAGPSIPSIRVFAKAQPLLRMSEREPTNAHPEEPLSLSKRRLEGLALARLEAAVGLVDDVGAAPAADHAAVAVARLEGLQGVADLHGSGRLPVWSDCLLEKRGAPLICRA